MEAARDGGGFVSTFGDEYKWLGGSIREGKRGRRRGGFYRRPGDEKKEGEASQMEGGGVAFKEGGGAIWKLEISPGKERKEGKRKEGTSGRF